MTPPMVQAAVTDPSLLAELYQQFRPHVMRVCRYVLRSPDDAEDASSEVFARLPRALRTYDRSQPFPRWLSTLAFRYCLDVLRQRRSEQRALRAFRREPVRTSGTAGSPLSDIVSNQERQAVRGALGQLPERYYVPLVMRYYSELSYQQIARTLEISSGYAKALVFRAKAQLRRALKVSARTLSCYDARLSHSR